LESQTSKSSFPKRGYRRLPEADVDAIKAAEPFLARTTYFVLLNALPDGLQRQFLAGLMLDDNFDEDEASFDERARRLVAFIEEHVLAAGDLIQGIESKVNELELRAPDGSETDHEFVEDESNEAPQDIRKQAEAFRRLDAVLAATPEMMEQDENLLHTILSEMESTDRRNSERRFERIFRQIG
jgi:hypothetical protein